MTKKFKFTSLASYVFLALAFAAFFACNLGTKVSSSLAVEEGVTLKSYDYAWHLMSLLSGRMFSTNHNIAIVGWALIAATVIALIALLFNKKGYSRRMFEIEAVQVVACLFITLGFIFIFRHFNWLKQYNSYNGRKIVYLGWIICFVLYCITQGLAYLFTLFRKGDAVAETAPVAEKVEEPVEEKPVEEEKVEEPVEETPVEEEKPAEEEKVEEPVEETPVEEPAPVEEVKEEPVVETAVVAAVVAVDETEEEKIKREKVTFEQRLAKADPSLVDAYHEIRNEIMSYGIKSRVSSSGDTFRLHTVKYMKIVVAGKKLKLYMKLDPKAYDDTPIPHGDASSKNAYVEIPFVFKVKSDLSIKRAKSLIADMMKEAGFEKKEIKVEEVEETEEETPVEDTTPIVAPVEEEPVEEEIEETEDEEVEDETEDEEVEDVTADDASATKVKREKVTFEQRLAKADPSLVEKYNDIKNEIMSYGVKSRVSSSGDTFRLHTVKYMKMVVAGKKIKLYMKLNPKDYDDTPIPHGDASTKNAYAEIPFVFKVNSDLSVKRAKNLIADMMNKAGLEKKSK